MSTNSTHEQTIIDAYVTEGRKKALQLTNDLFNTRKALNKFEIEKFLDTIVAPVHEPYETICTNFGYKPTNLSKVEFKLLPWLISKDETLIGAIEGIIDHVGTNKFKGSGILILTNKRLIFYRKSILEGIEVKEIIPIDKVSSVSNQKSFLGIGTIIITTSHNDAQISGCIHAQAEKMANCILNAMSNSNLKSNTSSINNIDMLDKLFELKQKGAITENEYEEQKQKLLNK